MKMTVKIGTAALSTSESLDSLRETPTVMHRIHFEVTDTKTWYAIMKEARTLYGKNFRSQPHVKRRLENNWARKSVRIWFDVPDAKFSTWVAVKHAVNVTLAANK
jgi:hypothetical protein